MAGTVFSQLSDFEAEHKQDKFIQYIAEFDRGALGLGRHN
jgi:hypothetical protein